MALRQNIPLSTVDRREQLRIGAVSAGVTVLAMAICFAVIAGVLIARETIILLNIWTRIVALGLMYLVPHFVAGLLVGARYGVGVVEPLVAGVVPVVVATVALAAFGGPVATIIKTPMVLLLAVVVWTGLFAGGQFLGTRVLAPRLAERSLLDRFRSDEN